MPTPPLPPEQNARLVVDFLHRTIMHHALWYAEVHHQLGPDKARALLWQAYERSYPIQMQRLAQAGGFTMCDDLPAPLLAMETDRLQNLLHQVAINWLANDGVWFQAVETACGMDTAKRCNDSCWAHFSPFEASAIRRFTGLPERCGLEGLKKALSFRLYATVNTQSIVEETADSFVFQMNECRVQRARTRKGLPDYPCKSGGITEYTTFAETIDARIITECIACPPDEHPDTWYCAWRFTLPSGG